MSENNPFTPPESNLSQKPPSGSQFIREFPVLPTMLFIGLALMTLGLYVYAWVYTRNIMMNRCLPEFKRIPAWLSNSTVVLGVINVFMVVFAMFAPETDLGGSTRAAQSVLNMLSLIFMIVWLFAFRTRLNELTGAQPNERLWLNGFILVLFNGYYLQYKINQIHEFGEQDMQPPSDEEDNGRSGYLEL